MTTTNEKKPCECCFCRHQRHAEMMRTVRIRQMDTFLEKNKSPEPKDA